MPNTITTSDTNGSPALGRHFLDDGKPNAVMLDSQTKAKRRLIAKIQTGTYEFVETTCLCGASPHNAILLSEKDRYGFSLKSWLCKKCSLIYASPYFADTSLIHFYADDYRDLYETETDATDQFFQGRYSDGKAIVRFVQSFMPDLQQRQVFEVGCASGGILQAFTEAGAECMGCDLDQRYLNYGRRKGLNLIKADFLSDYSIQKQFDLIILSEVLEHLRHPREALMRIRSALKPKGRFYLEVPNVAPRIDFLGHLQNAHLWYFDQPTLESLLKECGFHVLTADEPSIILRVLAEPCEPKKTSSYPAYQLKLQALLTRERRRSIRRDATYLLNKLGLKQPLKNSLSKAKKVLRKVC